MSVKEFIDHFQQDLNVSYIHGDVQSVSVKIHVLMLLKGL